MTSNDRTIAATEASASAVMELQTACVTELVASMKSFGSATGPVSKAFTDFVNVGLEASITAQKDAMQMAGDAFASADPQAVMALPQQLLQVTVRQSMEHSIRNMKLAQTLFAQINHLVGKTADSES